MGGSRGQHADSPRDFLHPHLLGDGAAFETDSEDEEMEDEEAIKRGLSCFRKFQLGGLVAVTADWVRDAVANPKVATDKCCSSQFLHSVRECC